MKLLKVISITLVLILSGCIFNKNNVVGRPLDFNDHGFLIADTSNVDAHIWVEITEDTDLSHSSLNDINWNELWRYRLKANIGKVDKSTYPYRAKAHSIKTSYFDIFRENLGVVVSVSNNSILVNELDMGLIYVSIDEDTKVITNDTDTRENGTNIFKFGDLVEFKISYVMESYPAQTTAKKIIKRDRIDVPDEIVDYFNDEDAVFIGMVGTLDNKVVPMYTKIYEECTKGSKVYKEYEIVCDSLEDYVILYNDEVLSLKEAFKNEIMHPRIFDVSNYIRFNINESYYTNYGDSIFTYKAYGLKIHIYNLLNEKDRYFVEYSNVTNEDIIFKLYKKIGGVEEFIISRHTDYKNTIAEIHLENNYSYVIKLRKPESDNDSLYVVGKFKVEN